MKIIIDARLYGLEHAGPGRYVMNLVDELTRLDRKNQYIVILRKKYFESLKLPKNWKKELFDVRQYTIKEQILLPFVLRKFKPDLVHFPHLNVPVLYYGKFVVTLHDIIMHKHKGGEATTRPFPVYQVWRMGYHLSFIKAARGSKKIITPSKAVKKELVDYYSIDSSKITPIYEGVDERISTKNNKRVLKKYKLNSQRYFMFVGSAYPHKNLDRAIQAIVRLNSDKKSDYKFAIISSRNVFTKRLEEKIKKYNASGYVKLLGFVPDDELGTIYKNSLAFVYPSLSEGFGLPGLEAIKAGTISIVSDVDVFGEVYSNRAISVDPYSVDSITDGLKKVAKMTKTERKKFINKAQSFISKYSWDKMANETLKVYESIR